MAPTGLGDIYMRDVRIGLRFDEVAIHKYGQDIWR